MNIKDSVALVTGANRGLGAAFVRALLAAGASKVYAAARDPLTITEPGVVPVRLDVTSPDDILCNVVVFGFQIGGGFAQPFNFHALSRLAFETACPPRRLCQRV
ncbi:hypothetical protein [Dickeya dianthicola]|uniref:hypothetical protein n=1 Tax=Dickeya dianthicola TaxID=204039 RepID=UPI00301B5AF4